MNAENHLLILEHSVFSRNMDEVSRSLQNLFHEKVPARDVIQSLSKGIERAREQFKNGRFSIPDFLLAIDAYKMGLELLRKYALDNNQMALFDAPRVVIGVVSGDLHDMGKNIVAAVLQASGFMVYDAGRNVADDVFLHALEQTRASVLALSTMMSTTIKTMETLIHTARAMFPGIAVIVGGAPFDADLARAIGADGYAENAIAAPDETRKLLAGPLSVPAESAHS